MFCWEKRWVSEVIICKYNSLIYLTLVTCSNCSCWFVTYSNLNCIRGVPRIYFKSTLEKYYNLWGFFNSFLWTEESNIELFSNSRCVDWRQFLRRRNCLQFIILFETTCGTTFWPSDRSVRSSEPPCPMIPCNLNNIKHRTATVCCG